MTDHHASDGCGPEDWQEDDELVECELMCLLASGVLSIVLCEVKSTDTNALQNYHFKVKFLVTLYFLCCMVCFEFCYLLTD
jgi:hypothetical protein